MSLGRLGAGAKNRRVQMLLRDNGCPSVVKPHRELQENRAELRMVCAEIRECLPDAACPVGSSDGEIAPTSCNTISPFVQIREAQRAIS